MLRHERLLFALATLGGLVHAVDEVFFAEEAYRAIPVAIGSALVLAYYPRLGATARGRCPSCSGSSGSAGSSPIGSR